MSDIYFRSFEPATRCAINQCLNYAIGSLDEDVENVSDRHRLQQIVEHQMFFDRTAAIAGYHLNSVLDDAMECVAARLPTESEQDALDEYSIQSGVALTVDQVVELRHIARFISIYRGIEDAVNVDLELNEDKLHAAASYLLTKQEINLGNYGQYNVGIVISGIHFDIADTHPLARNLLMQLIKLVEEDLSNAEH